MIQQQQQRTDIAILSFLNETFDGGHIPTGGEKCNLAKSVMS